MTVLRASPLGMHRVRKGRAWTEYRKAGPAAYLAAVNCGWSAVTALCVVTVDCHLSDTVLSETNLL